MAATPGPRATLLPHGPPSRGWQLAGLDKFVNLLAARTPELARLATVFEEHRAR